MVSRISVRAALAVVAMVGAAWIQQPGRVVAITIDDLPAVAVSVTSNWESVTNRLLAALRDHGAPAVGFVDGAASAI